MNNCFFISFFVLAATSLFFCSGGEKNPSKQYTDTTLEIEQLAYYDQELMFIKRTPLKEFQSNDFRIELSVQNCSYLLDIEWQIGNSYVISLFEINQFLINPNVYSQSRVIQSENKIKEMIKILKVCKNLCDQETLNPLYHDYTWQIEYINEKKKRNVIFGYAEGNEKAMEEIHNFIKNNFSTEYFSNRCFFMGDPTRIDEI